MRFLRIAKINSEQKKQTQQIRKLISSKYEYTKIKCHKENMLLINEKGPVCSEYCNTRAFLVMKNSYFSKDKTWIHNLSSTNSA